MAEGITLKSISRDSMLGLISLIIKIKNVIHFYFVDLCRNSSVIELHDIKITLFLIF